MSDEYAETDEWPLPRYTGSSKVPATFHPSEAPTVTRGPEWRDRGLIIAAQQTRIAQLEAQIVNLRSLDGFIIGAAADHREDTKRGGCTCGFCAWSPEHVAIMSYLEAINR